MLGRQRCHVGAVLLLLTRGNGLTFHVHRVSTKNQCLDTVAFRRWSMRCERRIRFADQPSSSTDISNVEDPEQEMDKLQMMRNELLSDKPKDSTKYEAFGGAVTQFAAILESDDNEIADDFLTQIVGVIEAEPMAATKGRTFALPSRLHISNLRTHHSHRRQGIGKALVEAVMQHATNDDFEVPGQGKIEAVTLKVERDQNPAAVQLYESIGFEFCETVYPGFMIKSLT